MVDLIVLNYNDFITTSQFIENTKDFISLDHIIVVDNCSSDQSFSMLKKYQSEKINVIRTSENLGYAAGNNYGAHYSKETHNPDYIVFANPDVIISNDSINEMIKIAEKTDNLGCISVKMECTSGVKLPVGWKLPRYKDCLLENLIILDRLFGSELYYSKADLSASICMVDVVPGSFFMIRANTFFLVGGFDENTFLYYEENILAFKLREKQYRSILLTNHSYVHNHSVSINKSIKSLSKKLNIAYNSRKYYCIHYLKISKFQKLLLELTHIIGIFSYLIAKKCKSIFDNP